VLSVYVDLDPSEFATGPARSSALTSAADEASRAVEDEARGFSHDTRLRLRDDVIRIRDYAKQADFGSTHGLAIFAAAGAGLFEPLHLPHSVANRVCVDGSPYVAPLVGRSNGSWCVALVTRRDGRLLSGGPLRLVEGERIEDDVPGRHDQGGLSQSRYERHIDDQAHKHLVRVAKRLGVLRRDGGFEHLLVGGTEQCYSEFVELLDNETRERLCGRLSIDVEHVAAAEVTRAAAPLMREHDQRLRQQLLDRVEEGLAPDGHAAAGLDEVVGCLEDQRVATLLVDAAWLREHQPGERIVELALAQNAETVRFANEPRIQAHGGIAALLRF
jgi:hypothetical protein